MRKLGILIAAATVATLGLVGFAANPAHANGHQGAGLCDALPTGEDADAQAGTFGQDSGEPFTSTFDGLHESCEESNIPGLKPSPLLCGIAKGLDAQPGQELGSSTVGAVNDGIAGSPAGDTPLATFKACGPTVDPVVETGGPDNPGNGGGGGDEAAAPAVLANNATADGGLPRTGGELFAGAGFAVASLGALIRRFIR